MSPEMKTTKIHACQLAKTFICDGSRIPRVARLLLLFGDALLTEQRQNRSRWRAVGHHGGLAVVKVVVPW
jgi:hypothetical protein